MEKRFKKILSFSIMAATAVTVSASRPAISNVKMHDFVGDQIDLCIAQRLMPQDIDHLIQPFRNQDETRERGRQNSGANGYKALWVVIITTTTKLFTTKSVNRSTCCCPLNYPTDTSMRRVICLTQMADSL